MFPFYSAEELQFKKQGTLSFFRKENTEKMLSIEIELAISDFEQTRGLMWREVMEEHQGMLFIFEEEAPRSFWMLNTYIPLDIIYINAQKEIVSIHKAKPHSIKNIKSEQPAQYTLEVNQGFCEKYGIKAGDSIDFEL